MFLYPSSRQYQGDRPCNGECVCTIRRKCGLSRPKVRGSPTTCERSSRQVRSKDDWLGGRGDREGSNGETRRTRMTPQKLYLYKTISRLGPIDVLVANAGSPQIVPRTKCSGIGAFAPFHLSNSDDWWRILELNLRAPVDLVRAVLPAMLERNAGTIICTTSRAALVNFPFASVGSKLVIATNYSRIMYRKRVCSDLSRH